MAYTECSKELGTLKKLREKCNFTRTSFNFVQLQLKNFLQLATVLVETGIWPVVSLAILEHQVQVFVDGPEVDILAILEFLSDLEVLQ